MSKKKIIILSLCSAIAVLLIYSYCIMIKVEVLQGQAQSLDDIPGLSVFINQAAITDIPINGPFLYVVKKEHYNYRALVIGKMSLGQFEPYFYDQKQWALSYDSPREPDGLFPYLQDICDIEKLRNVHFNSGTQFNPFDAYTSASLGVSLNDDGDCIIKVLATTR